MIGTLLFSGDDLASVATVQDLSEFWSSADLRGELTAYPGVSGAVPLQRPVAAQVRTAQVTVRGASASATEAAVAAVKALVKPNIAQTVTRRRLTSAGFLDATQTAITRSIAERWVTSTLCQLLIPVETVDGVWYGSSVSIASVAGTQTIDGDVPTSKIMLTLDAGAARTVSNQTNGFLVQFMTTVPTGGVLIDVEARTATANTGGTDMSRYLQWPKVHPLQLNPGDNTIAIDAGTASLTYQPAYL